MQAEILPVCLGHFDLVRRAAFEPAFPITGTGVLLLDDRRVSKQQRLVKTGGRLVKHARYYWLLLAESHLTRRLFGSMVRRIASLPLPAG